MPATEIYLSGGPCDGKTVSANKIHGGLVAYIPCGGGFYVADDNKRRGNGDPVWKYAGKTKPGPPGGDGAVAPHAHKGWADLQHTVNKRWHPALSKTARLHSAALHSLSRASRVRL